MELHRFLLIVTLAIVAILGITAWFFPLNDDFRTENTFWNGSQEIVNRYSLTPLESLAELASAPAGATLILIPYLSFTPAELELVSDFVSRGGTLILADDYGYGNQILEYLGLRVRFSTKALLDPISHYKNKWFPKISHLKPSPLTINISSLIFNRATTLSNAEGSDILALSSSFSFLDQNGNHLRDEEEPVGPFPVISRHYLGNGQVILIADPSIFINCMQSWEGNHTLLHNIANITTSELFIDQSHLPPSTLYQAKCILSRLRNFLAQPLGTIGVILALLAITLRPIWHKPSHERRP